MAQWEGCATASIGEEAAKANTHETARQSVKKEAAKELVRRYGHQLLLALKCVIFPAERDVALSNANDPVI